MNSSLSLTSTALPSATRVLAFRGTEALSALYAFEIQLLIADSAFDMGAALGASATLSVVGDAETPDVFHGILVSVESVAEVANGAIYVVTLAPRLSRLTLTQHSRAFVDESLPAILQTVLKLEGFTVQDYTFELSGDYPRHSHVCQYQESSLSFISRRMEREGLYWYFEQGETQEKLVVTDDRGSHRSLSDVPVRYALVTGRGAGSVAGLQSFNCKHRSLPGRVELRGYDYLRPALEISGDATIAGGTGTLRVQENFTTTEEGNRLARIRAEELEARKVIFRGAGSVFSLRPGYRFKVEDHPRFDGEYLTIELAHSGNQLAGVPDAVDVLGTDGAKDGYRVELVAIPASAQFRSERQTSVPRIYGTERATIDGEAESGYAQLDEHGRYLVKIHFDETVANPGKASPRIRMMQPHGGGTESFHFPLRKGTEVMLTFEGGDPDRPVIAGVVPNLVTPSPVTSKNATKNVIQTGGGNKIVIEDASGKEYVHIRTPHKGTYLHLGAPFNPSYTKTSYTDGTSLSFTRDISTSVTGTDAQTLVEDSRITIIGRSKIGATDPQGKQIATLVGSEFIDRPDDDPIFDLIAGDVKQAITDMIALRTAVEKVASAQKTLTADTTVPEKPQATIDQDQYDLAAAITAVQSAAKAAFGDMSTLRADAEELDKSGAKAGDVDGWKSAVAAAFTAMSKANDAVNPTDKNAPAVTSTTVADNFDVPLYKTLGAPLNTDETFVKGSGGETPPAPKTATPVLPNPSSTANYIAIRHPPDQTTTLAGIGVDGTAEKQVIDDWITKSLPLEVDKDHNPIVQPDDLTGFSNIPTTFQASSTGIDTVTNGAKAKEFNSGSDVKIVGGDNVTMVAHDARSQIEEHSYSLIRGGQTSVLYASGRSTLDPSKLKRPYLGYVSSPGPSLAQAATTYGDTFSWVDGSTTAHVTGDTSSEVDGTAHAKINGGQTSFVSGYQQSFVRGSRSAEIFGNDLALVIGAKESITIGANASVVVGADAKIVLAAQFDCVFGPHTSVHPTKLEAKVSALDTTMTEVKSTVMELQSKVTWMLQAEIAIARMLLHVEQKSTWICVASLTLLE